MQITFIKKLSADGQTSADSIELERDLRQKGFWQALTAVRDSATIAGPRLVIESQAGREEFTNAAAFQQRFDLDTVDRQEYQAACW